VKSSIERRAQSLAAETQQTPCALDATHRLFDVNHPQPLVGADVLAEVFGIGLSAVYKNAKRGLYDDLRATLPIGPRKWSGFLLARHCKGEPVYMPTFGRRRKAS